MKKILLLTLGIIMGLFLTGHVKAETISYKKLDNIYFNLKVNGVSSSNYVTMFYLDGRLAYCIEPGKDINTRTYNSTNDWSKTSISADKQKLLEKIGYFGYEYTSHQTPRYYIATQELIWETIGGADIYWTTGPNGSGSTIDVSKEKNEIMSLVNKYDTSVSFASDTIIGEVGSHLEIEDNNGVLNNYNITDSVYHKIDKQDNKLVIDFNSEEREESILLTRKNNYSDLLLVYTMPGSQSLASLRISSPKTYAFKLKSVITPKEYPKKEVVKVPSTSDDSKIMHFNILKIFKYDNKRFN